MKYRVRYTIEARREIRAAYLWLAERAPMVAAKWFNRLHEAIRTLDRFPRRCMLAVEAEFFDQEIRQLIVGRYRVLFTIEARQVVVLHVRHSSRDFLRPDGD